VGVNVNILTVNINNCVLPNGLTYQSGDTAILSDEEYEDLPASMFSGATPQLTVVSTSGSGADYSSATYAPEIIS